MRPSVLALAALALLAPFAAAVPAPGALAPSVAAVPGSATVDVTVLTGFVAPVTVIGVGGSVTWTNIDVTGQHHTATSFVGSPHFDTGHVVPGQSYTIAFPASGVWAYHCQIHPWLVGVVVVQ
jgi:plastocyanin